MKRLLLLPLLLSASIAGTGCIFNFNPPYGDQNSCATWLRTVNNDLDAIIRDAATLSEQDLQAAWDKYGEDAQVAMDLGCFSGT